MEPYGSTIFCDDIRYELFNKVSLIGVYGNELVLFGKFPTAFPKLALHISVRFHRSHILNGAKLLVYFPGDPEDKASYEEEMNWKVDGPSLPMPNPADFPDPGEFYSVQHPLTFSPAVINKSGYIRVRILEGKRRIKVGALKLREGTPEELASQAAPPQPKA